mmetsp:Transcript_5287/g.16722  ORF Transcript_5287/g.16722 Transcript_5287/m.16722 type:complete len:258 (-) Transcript_5287:745-1518(-)
MCVRSLELTSTSALITSMCRRMPHFDPDGPTHQADFLGPRGHAGKCLITATTHSKLSKSVSSCAKSAKKSGASDDSKGAGLVVLGCRVADHGSAAGLAEPWRCWRRADSGRLDGCSSTRHREEHDVGVEEGDALGSAVPDALFWRGPPLVPALLVLPPLALREFALPSRIECDGVAGSAPMRRSSRNRPEWPERRHSSLCAAEGRLGASAMPSCAAVPPLEGEPRRCMADRTACDAGSTFEASSCSESVSTRMSSDP